MELARRTIRDIASASQGVICTATEYAIRRGYRNTVQSCHFRLEKEMQRISVAAEGMLGILSKSSLPNDPPLDNRLQDWFSTDEPRTCLDTLNQMQKMLRSNTVNTIFSFAVTKAHTSPPEDKIDVALKFFDAQRNYFHFLLTTDVWNYEEAQQQPQALPAHVQYRSASELAPEPNIHNTSNVPFNTANRPTAEEERGRMKIDDLRKLDDILRWLDGLSCAAKQEETLSLRQPDTCTWIHSTPEYELWRNTDDSFLWLQGKPGSGKTVLTSFVVDSLKHERRGGEVLAFFYCDFRNDRSTSAAEVMHSLLSQLLRRLRDDKIVPGELLDALVGGMDGDMPVLKNIKYLATFVSRTAKQLSHQPLVVVDALDECQDIEKLLGGLLTLAEGGMRLFVTSRPLQIIKDGLRDLPSISMDKMTRAVSTDIALHVTRELDSRQRLRDLELHFKKEIHSILCNRADGMFRWVQCQINTLNRCATRAEIRDSLDNLPIGLNETYRRILIAIDVGSPEGKLALRTLVWLVGALRPLRLLEILDGLTIDLGRRTLDPETGAMHKGALFDACGSLVTYSEDTDILILSHFSVKEYLTGDLTRIELPQYHISYQGAHLHLARLCICYLALYLIHVHTLDDTTALSRIMRIIDGRSCHATGQRSQPSENSLALFSTSQELLSYVFTDGFNHLAYLSSANHAVLNDMMALQLDIRRYPDAWDVIYQMSRDYKPSIPLPAPKHDFMFYVLIAFSSPSLFLAFLRRSHSIRPMHQTNPLVYAAHFGKAQHTEMLLSRGAQVDERGLVINASRQALPLEVAVGRRHDAVVDLLLSAGSMVPKRLFTLSTYYRKYPVRVVRMLLEMDQFVEWAVEEGNQLPSPLRILEQRPPLAYETDTICIIRRLVQVGVDHTERDSAQRTALYLAILGGYQAIVVYLLLIGTPLSFTDLTSIALTSSKRIPMLRLVVEAGIDVHAHVGTDGNTMLHLAIRFFQDDCLEAVKILIGAGCKPFVRNAARETPLHLALKRRSSAVADYLLSQGTPPSDVLFAVVESKCPTIWRLKTLRALVDAGADIHGITHYEGALLHREMISQEEHQGLEMVELPGAGRKTPLDLVADCNSSLLADYLLSTGRSPPADALFAVLRSGLSTAWKSLTISSLVGKGADVHGLSSDGNTLLHATIHALDECQGLDVVKLLVGAGCDPFWCTADGKTPLHIALDRKFPIIADYLLSLGQPLPRDALLAILQSALSENWRIQAISSLVGKGVDIHGLSADGNTLLHLAGLYVRQADMTKLLVDAGCDLSVRNSQGKTALHIAAEKGSIPVVEYILSLDQSLPDDILFSVLKSLNQGKVPMLRMLIDKGANTHAVAVDGNNLLHVAVSSLSSFGLFAGELVVTRVLEMLVEGGCDAFAPNAHGKTPLHLAVLSGRVAVVECLLSITTPPHLLADILASAVSEITQKDIAQLLIDKGANVHVRAADGGTLLHVAIKDNKWLVIDSGTLLLEIIKLLVDSGCNPSQCDNDGRLPIYFAITKGRVKVVEYLLPRTVPLPRNLQDAMKKALPLVRDELREVLKEHLESLPENRKPSLARRVMSRLRLG